MEEQDKTLSVRFWLHPRENPAETKRQGRPIYDEVEMVSIMAPGNQKTEFTARADRMHYDSNVGRQWTYAERFPEAYAAFKRGIEDYVQGTPIADAPFLTVGQKAEMKASKIATIEQLAGMTDRDIRAKGAGFRAHVDAAKAYLETTTGASALTADMEELRKQNEALMARLSALEGGKKDVPASDEGEFAGFGDDDLRNMLQDATGEAPDGRLGRKGLIKKLRELQAEQAA